MSTPRIIQGSIISLANSLEVLESMVEELEQTFLEEPVAPVIEQESSRHDKMDIAKALDRLVQKIRALVYP